MERTLYHAHVMGIDAYQPPFYPDERFDADAIIEVALKIKADVIRVSVMGKYANFQTQNWPMPPALKGRDFIGELIEKAHAHQLLIVPYIPGAVHLPYDMVTKYHPEWIQKRHPLDKEPYTMTGHSGTDNVMVCPIQSYRKFYFEMLTQTLLHYDFDGWYSDAWKDCYFREVCYCDDCRAEYMELTGEDIYTPAYYEGGEHYDELVKWYRSKLMQLVYDAFAFVQSKKKLVTIINGIAGVLGDQSQGSWGKDIDDMYDILHFERKTDPYNRLVSATYSAVLDRPSWFYAGLYSPLQFYGSDKAEENYADERKYPYRKELYNEYMIPIAAGQSVNQIRSNSLIYDKDNDGYRILQDIGGFLEKHRNLLYRAKYLPDAGFLSSSKSRSELNIPLLQQLIQNGLQITLVKYSDLRNTAFLRKFNLILAIHEDFTQELLHNYIRTGGLCITDDPYALQLIEGQSALLEETESADYYLCGRGRIAFLKQEEKLESVMEHLTNGLRIKTSYSNGELVTILSESGSDLLCFYMNITNHLSGLLEEGLTEIPAIDRVRSEVRCAQKVKGVYSLRKEQPISFEYRDQRLSFEVRNLNEFDVIKIECETEA